MALIGFDLLEKSDTTPKLTSIFRNRPSHISDTSFYVASAHAYPRSQFERLTLFVDALAFTTPRISSEWPVIFAGIRGWGFSSSEMVWGGGRRIHHSAPIVHSLS